MDEVTRRMCGCCHGIGLVASKRRWNSGDAFLGIYRPCRCKAGQLMRDRARQGTTLETLLRMVQLLLKDEKVF